MKYLLLILLFSSQAFAANRYVKNAGGTGTGASDAAAWSPARYLSQRNTIAPGDTVFWNRGETYNIALTLTDNNGTSSADIVYAAYGTGAKPIFTGLTTMTGWTLSSGNIYYTTLDVPRLQVVTFDGMITGMGRYPKSGYLPFTSHNNLSSITATNVSSIPGDPTGGEVVIKKSRFLIDRHYATSRVGNQLNIGGNSDFGEVTAELTDGNGYFIQNKLFCLTQDKDWYYDTALNRLYVYFAGGNTSSHVVQASKVSIVADASGKSYITLLNLDIRGGNEAGVSTFYGNHIKVLNCEITNCTEGIQARQGAGYVTADYCNIERILSTGIAGFQSNNVTINHCNIRDIHMIPGMGKSGDLVGSGTAINGDDLYVGNSTVKNTGYGGITWYAGHRTLVENNLVDTFDVNKDDGGGIYAYGYSLQTYQRRTVRNNVILHGIGNVEGVSPSIAGMPFAVGIYMDNYSSNVNIYNNISAYHSGCAILFNGVANDTLTNNTTFDCYFMNFLMLDEHVGEVRGLYVTNNTFIAKTPLQILLDFEMYVDPAELAYIGTWKDNTFYRPFGLTNFIRQDDRRNNGQVVNDYDIAGWNSLYNKETGSAISTVPISSPNDFRLDYNLTPSSALVILPGVYKDISNTTYSGLINIPSYSGKVLVFNAALLPKPGTKLQINFRKIITTP